MSDEGNRNIVRTVSDFIRQKEVSHGVMWLGAESFEGVYNYLLRYLTRYAGIAHQAVISTEYTSDNKDIREKVYVHVKELLKNNLRSSDALMQIDEGIFFLILPDTDEAGAITVKNRITEAWEMDEYARYAQISIASDRLDSNSSGDRRGTRKRNDWVAVVDDDMSNLMLAGNILSSEGIRVSGIQSGQGVLDFVKDNRPDLILMDIKMPGMDGFETARELRKADIETRRIPIIFFTSDESEDAEETGFKLGAADFIKKPVVPATLVLRVKTTLELTRLRNNLADEVESKTIDIEKKTKENEILSLHIVMALAQAIDAKDTYTNGHSERVAKYSREIARRYGYSKEQLEEIYMMGLLHDVGKIGVPNAIINKSGRLTDEEFAIIKTHPEQGAKILSNIKEMPHLSEGARWHHERYDGKGYPDGLKGLEIPEEARIIAVADAYDAMTSNRSYREPLSQMTVRGEIEKGSGLQFDPNFAAIMLQMIDEDTEYDMREK